MTATQHRISEKVRESIEEAHARLTSFEDEAQKVVADLLRKGRASRKEFKTLIHRLNTHEILEASPMKDLSGRAKHVREDLSHRLEVLVERAIAFSGVASREQVEDLARDLERLSRKLDKAVVGAARKGGRAKA